MAKSRTPPSSSKPRFPQDEHDWLIRRFAYELFIAMITVTALTVMIAYYFVPLPPEVDQVLVLVDFMYALVLLADFGIRLRYETHRVRYFFTVGWLDLLGSLPGLPLLRVLRIVRLWITFSYVRKETYADIRADARSRLAENTLLVVGYITLLVITLGSIAIVLVEPGAADTNIRTGADAMWWALVTVATVGYGDTYPTTSQGRIVGVVMILVGVGLFSVLTSYLASTFVNRGNDDEIAQLRDEMREVKNLLWQMQADHSQPTADQTHSATAQEPRAPAG
jgi:voltage-gated potassium channel